MMRRLAFHLFAAFLMTTVWVTTVVAPGMAASTDAGLLLSADGRSWSTHLAQPLFSAEVAWVPGDVRTTSLFVANRGPTAADVRVQLTTSADQLVRRGDISFDARLAGEPWQHLGRGNGGAVLTHQVALPRDGERRIDLRASFLPESTNSSQASAVDLQFVVELTQTAAAGSSESDLPGTGAPRLWLPGLVGLLFVVLGAGVLRRESRGSQASDG